MRKPFVALLSVAASFGVAASAHAADAFAMTDLNLRAGPGPQYPVVSTIPNNGSVAVQGCLQSWCDVSFDGARGWAYSSYLGFDVEGQRVLVPEMGTKVEVPIATFEGETYWTENYADRPFYAERDRYVGGGAPAGAVTGAITGAVVGGPIGAVVGGLAGAAVGSAAVPPERVRSYVSEQPSEPVFLDGEVVVGAGLPEPVFLNPIPDYEYRYAIVNGQRVLVDPSSRQIVYIYR